MILYLFLENKEVTYFFNGKKNSKITEKEQGNLLFNQEEYLNNLLLNNSLQSINILPKKKINKMTTGLNHALLLTESGLLYSFGNNKKGQLGVSVSTNTSNFNSPIMMTSLLNYRVVDISSGENHNIAVINYRNNRQNSNSNLSLNNISNDSEKSSLLYSWGCNKYGQLGSISKANITRKNSNNIKSNSNYDNAELIEYIDTPSILDFSEYISKTYENNTNNNKLEILSIYSISCGKNFNIINTNLGVISFGDNRNHQISNRKNSTDNSSKTSKNDIKEFYNKPIFNYFEQGIVSQILTLPNDYLVYIEEQQIIVPVGKDYNFHYKISKISSKSTSNNKKESDKLLDKNTSNKFYKTLEPIRYNSLENQSISIQNHHLNNSNNNLKDYDKFNINRDILVVDKELVLLNKSLFKLEKISSKIEIIQPQLSVYEEINDLIEVNKKSNKNNDDKSNNINSKSGVISSNTLKQLRLLNKNQFKQFNFNIDLHNNNRMTINTNIDEINNNNNTEENDKDPYSENASTNEFLESNLSVNIEQPMEELRSYINMIGLSIPESNFLDNDYQKSCNAFRPVNLPKKTKTEEEMHKRLVEENRRLYLLHLKDKQNIEKEQNQELKKSKNKESSSATVWEKDIIPYWFKKKRDNELKKYFYDGVPSSLRGKIWLMCIGNNFSVTPDYYDIEVKKAM